MGKLLSLSQAIVFILLLILCIYCISIEKALHHVFSAVVCAVMAYAGIYEYRKELNN